MNIDEDLNRRKKEAEKAAQQKAAAAQERGWAGVDADLDRRKAQQEAAQRLRETERRQEEERRRMRSEQLARLSVGMGPEPLKPYSMQAETKALLSPLEQLKNQNTKYPRSFTDRDSVLQGKVAEAAAQRGNFAAFTGNETEYAKHLKNDQRAVGNLVQNAAEEGHRQYRAYLKDNPDVAYARSMHADEIERKITEVEQERAELEARRKANWDERQGIKLRGEVAYYDSHHVAHYGSKYDALEREDREAYARLQELEKELETLNSAKGLRTTFDAEKRVNAYESQARSNADFEALSSGRPESLNAFIGRNNGKNPENSWAQMVTQKYYGMTPDQKAVFHYLWAKDDEAGHAINGNEREAVQYMNAIPGLHDYYQKRQAEDAYIPQSYDNPLEKIAKVGRYLIDSLATGTDRAINADLVSKGVKAKNQDLLALAGQYAPEGFGGTLFRAAGSAAQSTGQMIPAIMAGNLAAAYVSAFPAAVASAGKATHDIVTAERIVKSAQNAVFFYTSKGQAMADAKEKGLTDAQAEIYSLLSAASEVWLQNAIGGVAQFGGIGERDIMLKINKINNAYLRTAAYHGLNVAGEVIEEEAQNFLEPLFVTMLTGQEYEMPSLQELLETFLSTAMMVSTTNVGANKEFYNSSKIRSNLQTMAELCRQEGGEYDQVAKSIEQYIQEVDAEPDGRFTKEGFYQAFNLVRLAEENMKAHGVTAEDVRSGMAELNEGAAAEVGTPPHPSPAATPSPQGEGLETGVTDSSAALRSAQNDGTENGRQVAHATAEAIQAAREKGRSIAIRSAETMDDGMIQATIRASEESAAGARQEGDLETAAMHEGIVQGLREVFDRRMAESDGLEFTGALRREYGDDADAQNGGTPPHPSPAATPSPQGEGLGGRPMTASTGNGGQIARATENGGQAMLVPTDAEGGRQGAVPTENGERAMLAPTNGQEGLSYGTERAEAGSGIADGVQRDAGLGTGGQAGSLGEGAGGSLARGGRAQELAQLKNLIRASESPRTSAKEIGVRGGTNNQNLFVFSEDEQTPGMQKVQEDAAANGINVVFFGGGRLEVRSKDGRIQKADALYQTNRDGSSTMYIRADLSKYTPEQLYKHESFHDAVAKNKGLLLDMVEDLYEQYSEAEISKMVDAYVVATDGIYGDGEDSVRLYLEEILADQYSGMNRGGNEAARAREAVAGTAQRFAGDIENARQNRAGIDRRSGPEQRFAIANAPEKRSYIEYQDQAAAEKKVNEAVKALESEGRIVRITLDDLAKVDDSVNWDDLKEGRTAIKGILKPFLGETLYFPEEHSFVEAYLTSRGINHAAATGGSKTKGAAFSKLLELVANAKYAYSTRNNKHAAQSERLEGKTYWDSYVAVAEVETAPQEGGEKKVVQYPVVFTLRSIDEDVRAQVYEMWAKNEAAVSHGDGTQNNSANALPNYGATTTSEERIADNNENVKQLFSAADEEDDGLTFTGNLRRTYEEDGTQKEGTPPHPSPAATPSPQGEGLETGETDSSPAAQNDSGEDFEMLAREKKLALAEKVGIDGLKNRIKTAEDRLRMWKAMEKTGLMAKDAKSVQELKSRIADAQETLDIFRDALKKKQEARKAEQTDKAAKAERQKKRAEEKKALRKEAELADNKPRQARKEFREEALNLFSVQAAKRQALGNILNSFADKMLAKGSVDTEDRAELFRQLYEAGVEVVQAEDYYRNIRETVDKARIYVPESVRAEFGDDWNDFRQRAWGNGVYLTNNQNDRGADSWNGELAEMFRGSFDPEETDARAMLENIVDLAEEGKAEFVSLPEMMRRNQSETGVTVDEQMDELERKVDHMIDTFAKKADLETRVRTQGAMKLAKERQKNRELAARQVQRKRENDTRNEVMKQLQSLNKMRKRSAPEIQQQIDQIIGNLDTMARSISPEGMENLQALARKYMEAKDDPNFLGNPYVEARLARLSQVQLDDLEISDVIELGRTISALVKSVTEDKRLLTDERNREISEAAKEVNKEIASSAGSKGGKLREFLGNEHLSPTRELQRIGGWNRGGMMEKLARALEDGGTRRMDYQRQATRIFDGFLADKANQKWLQKAQGKDADWIKVTVPAGITDEGGTVKWDNVSFEITPMMRVGLLMHSRNVDNLRHIETGGIVIPNREYYRKGDLANADAKGTRVKLRPEIVRAIVKDCTPQERAFAALLEKYYDGFSKEKINEVSMLIDGFERAGGDHYYGIKVSRKFLASLPEQIQKNMALESIGSIVNERVHAGNPIILEDASKALTDHIDLISKYYGFTAPIRDFNAVMNYTFHGGMNENGITNPYAGSIKEALQDKWGAGAQKYIDDLLADLQQSSGINETAAQFLAKLRGNLAGASLMFNPAVALSQTASLPGAMQTLGIDGVAASLKPAKVDMGLIEKYSPVLWYRNQGNSTQELGDYMARQGLEGKLPFFFNWIQKMDAWTIRRLWAGAEYRVSKDTDLAPGSKAEIDAGTDPYYQEVARIFQRAVYDTQPNYSEMQRPAILRSKSDLTKMLTMYKTVPLQYYNMMYEAAGRLKADKARFEQDGSAENKANYAKSRSFAAKTFTGVLGANVVYVVMKAAIKALLGGKDKKYKDEEGDWDAGKIFGSLGKDLAETYAGSVIFGSELMSSMEKLYNAATTGSYSRYGGLEISALGAVEDTLGSIYNLAKELHDQDLTGGLGAIKELAKQISMDLGVPANNIETYLLGTAKWFAPEWVDRYENFFDEFERADLKGEHGKDLRAALRVLMDNRTDGLKDETIDELMRLWETGQNAAVPSGIPTSVSVDGEDVEIKGADRGTFRERWGQVVDENLEELINSDAYKDSDDAGKAKLISKLYEYARQQAAAAVTSKQPDSWVTFGRACENAGIPLTDYLAVVSVDKSKLKDMDGEELDNAIQNRMSFRVGELDEKTLDELGRLYEAGESGVIPADVPTGISIGGEETKLTPEQRVEWLQAWQRMAGENLEALMASSEFQKADDAGKAKLISALYDVARASASDEVVPGYEPDKWIRTGLGAEERGVPFDEYTAFHVNLSELKTSEKLDLLKKQHWTNDQKEYIWEQTMATDAQLSKYQNLKNAGVRWSDAMDRLGIGASTTTTMLTESQQAQYDKYWNEISGPATQRLLNNSAYKSADKATQTEYLDRLNDYAARSAKAKVLAGYDKGKWVECGERLTSAGVKLDDYIVYYQNTSETNNRAKYEALAKTGWTDSQKLIALEYISSSTYSAGKVGQSYDVPLTSYLEALSKADADQSGNINQEEATEWIDNSSVAWDLKAYLWQMLCYSSKWKNNPYSTTRGEEIWHSLHPEG